MTNTYKVSNFYNVNLVDGNNEYNLSSININDFKFTKFDYTLVKKSEEVRPELICYRLYGTIEYWWIILEINNISNPWEDIKEGDIIKYPPESDIQKFIEHLKKNKGKNG